MGLLGYNPKFSSFDSYSVVDPDFSVNSLKLHLGIFLISHMIFIILQKKHSFFSFFKRSILISRFLSAMHGSSHLNPIYVGNGD
jgi:hypothetical protein